MKYRILLSLFILAAMSSCQKNASVLHTRGIGIYPGNPAECTAPKVIPGGKKYRNIALGRTAFHSSSWDFNLTAQLVTDGILPCRPAPWADLLVNGEAVEKRLRHYLTDLNITGFTLPGPQAVFEVILNGYEAAPDKVIVIGNVDGAPYATFEGSADGAQWTQLGKVKAVATKDNVGEVKLIFHKSEWVIPCPAAEPYKRFRLTIDAPDASEIKINEIFFYKDGELCDVQPGSRFCSCWKSEGTEDEWVTVDLGARSTFDRMVFHWLNAPVSGAIQVSADGKDWKTVCKVEEGSSFDTLNVKARARYVRACLDRTADREPFELGEWEIFGRGGTALSETGWTLARATEVDADGSVLSSASFDDSGWMPATVPGTVLASYVNAGAVPDPNHADNQRFISDSYFRSDFWYRHTFSARPGSECRFLHFAGINHRASVWLNGKYLGDIDGAFRQQDFNVGSILEDGLNYLAVLVRCNPSYATVREQNAYTPDTNGGLLGYDNPTMHATIGWDWIPTVRGRDMGIYGEVSLVSTGPVKLEDPFVRTELPLPDTSSATIFAQVRLVNHAARPVLGELCWSFGELAFNQEVTLAGGESALVSFDPAVLKNPKLWWPKGYGRQDLYDVKFTFKEGDAVSDELSFLSGVRQIDWEMESYIPQSRMYFKGRNNNQRLSLYVNGRRFIGFGGNWGFPEHLLNYRSREYDIAVGYHADMNFTFIRNWVGMTDSEAFYEACDRYGVMIWQDFWLANPWDGPDPSDPDRFNEIARQYVRRIRNHPSIALYVGRNEGYPPAEIDSFLEKMVPEEHPGMCYVPHSGADGVSGGGPYRALPAKDYFNQSGADKVHSERGMPNVMNYENLVRTMGEDNVEPYSSLEHPNVMYGLHDYALGLKGLSSAQRAQTFNNLLVKAFGEPADAMEFARHAQWINYDGYRAMFEGRAEYRRGLLLWMSHPAWPSMVWQTYDYYFEPTAAYFGCKKACEPVHIFYNPLKDKVEVVNYHAGNLSGLTASAEIFDLQGRSAWAGSAPLDIPEDQTSEVLSPAVPEDITDVYFLRLRLSDAAGAILSENFYTMGREEGNLKALLTLPEANVKMTRIAGGADKGLEWREVRLENKGQAPALMLRLKAMDSKTGDLILPVWYSDNYISLMPGESRTIRVQVRTEDHPGRLKIHVESCL